MNAYIHESCHRYACIYTWVTSQVWMHIYMSHVIGMNAYVHESCHIRECIYTWVMSHTWMHIYRSHPHTSSAAGTLPLGWHIDTHTHTHTQPTHPHTSSARSAGTLPICDMTHLCVWHDSFIYVTWLIFICDLTHLYMWHDSSICVTWLIYICDMTHLYMWHDSSICVTWLIYICIHIVCGMTQAWHTHTPPVQDQLAHCLRAEKTRGGTHGASEHTLPRVALPPHCPK